MYKLNFIHNEKKKRQKLVKCISTVTIKWVDHFGL